MTKLLEDAIATVRALPESDQDIVAKFLLAYADPGIRQYELSEEQAAEVERAKLEVREGKVASDEEMAEVWRRFGL